jgi:hypothetical protein
VKEANFSNHAKQRIGERCSLSQEQIKRILDNDGTVVIHLQKGGRYAHRLLYSVADEDWFMVVQDGGDGGVLTVIPLEFLKGRTSVTAAHKRQARKRALSLKKMAKMEPPKKQDPIPAKSVKTIPPLPGWRVQVIHITDGMRHSKSLGRTLEEHGDPPKWDVFGPVHVWTKSRLVDLAIPLSSVRGFVASKGKISQEADGLLEFLPMTEEEIKTFR